MSDLEKAARQALEALLKAGLGRTIRVNQKAIDSAVGILRAALAEQAEPVASEALRLADFLTDRNRLDLTCDEAAAELRRQHAEITRLEARERGREIYRRLNIQEPPDAKPKQAEPVAIPGAIPMSEVAARSRAMPERAEALERARERLKQTEPEAEQVASEALQLANFLTDRNRLDLTCDEAAAELRRQHAEIERLKQQTEPVVAMRPCDFEHGLGWYIDHPEFYADIEPDEAGVWSVYFSEKSGKSGKDAFGERKKQAEPVAEPVALTHDEVQRLAAQAGLPLAWISETGVIQWSQLERLIAVARQQAEPVADPTEGNPSF